MIIDEIVWRYRNGACFALAKALHQVTGWDIRYIQWGGFAHAFVLSPDGNALDIHGLMPWETFQLLLIDAAKVPADAIADGRFAHEAFTPELEQNLTLLYGYKAPSKSAIKQALREVRLHPNTADAISTLTRRPLAPGTRS